MNKKAEILNKKAEILNKKTYAELMLKYYCKFLNSRPALPARLTYSIRNGSYDVYAAPEGKIVHSFTDGLGVYTFLKDLSGFPEYFLDKAEVRNSLPPSLQPNFPDYSLQARIPGYIPNENLFSEIWEYYANPGPVNIMADYVKFLLERYCEYLSNIVYRTVRRYYLSVLPEDNYEIRLTGPGTVYIGLKSSTGAYSFLLKETEFVEHFMIYRSEPTNGELAQLLVIPLQEGLATERYVYMFQGNWSAICRSRGVEVDVSNALPQTPTQAFDALEEAVKPKSPLDSQVGGNHYKDMVIQPVEFIQKNNIPFIEGCIIKYACRHGVKNGIEDLKKIKHFVDLLIKLEYGGK